MIKDFWNTNHNPITMWSRNTSQKYEDVKRNATPRTVKYIVRDISKDKKYILQQTALFNLKANAKYIKERILESGKEYHAYSSMRKTYYLIEDIKNIEVVVKKAFTIPNEYISSTELRKIKDWNSWQLFDKASKNKWTKKRFKGNITYYLKSEVL